MVEATYYVTVTKKIREEFVGNAQVAEVTFQLVARTADLSTVLEDAERRGYEVKTISVTRTR